jgi:hypothetical protein
MVLSSLLGRVSNIKSYGRVYGVGVSRRLVQFDWCGYMGSDLVVVNVLSFLIFLQFLDRDAYTSQLNVISPQKQISVCECIVLNLERIPH